MLPILKSVGVDFFNTRMPDTKRISVLYVDDEPALLEVTKMFLERTGDFSVTTALSAAIANPLLLHDTFDAIVSDYQMPVVDGIEFLKQVRARDPGIPFILFTGKGREEIAILAINNGATFYLQKGGDVRVQIAELVHRLKISVAAARAEKELQENYAALKKQEVQIREQEAWYRALFENTGTAMVVIEPDTTVSLVNDKCATFLGSSRADIEGKLQWPDLVPEPERAQMMTWHTARRNSADAAPRDYVAPIITRIGEIRKVRITVTMIPGTERSIASLIDITDKERTEEALRQSETLHRTIFEISPEPIVVTNPDGCLSYVSPATVPMFGLQSEKEALGTWIFDWIAPEKRTEVRSAVQKFLMGDQLIAPPSLFPVVKKDGTRFFVEISSSKLINADGKLLGFVSVMRDVTDRITAETALRRAGEKLNLLSSITRHDIHNKLTVLLGYIELARVAKDPEVVKDFLVKIDEIAKLLGDQIEFTGDYQELGVHSPTWQGVAGIIDRAKHEIGINKIDVSDTCGYLEIFADPLLVKVVYNLIDNSIRHGGHVTSIRFSYQDKGTELVLLVEDNGVGVEIQDKERIFNKGFGKNTGFGLFLVGEILAITGMTVSETGFPGKGARFEIHVPQGNYRFRKPA